MFCPFPRILQDALIDKRAVGAFNVGNMEMLIGIIKAAEDKNTPVILQIAEKRFTHSPLEFIAPMLHAAAMRAKVDVALELDHGCSIFNIRRAMDLNFNTVMYDGSELPIEQNIEQTASIVKEAHKRGVAVEAEIGVVGGAEGGADRMANCASLEDIVSLGKKSGADALAVAIGNAHGHYKGKPQLNFDLLRQAHEALDHLPLVLHGGTGISPEDFKKAIGLGIAKINIATANFDATASAAFTYADTLNGKELSYFDLNEKIIENVYKCTCDHIEIFKV